MEYVYMFIFACVLDISLYGFFFIWLVKFSNLHKLVALPCADNQILHHADSPSALQPDLLQFGCIFLM